MEHPQRRRHALQHLSGARKQGQVNVRSVVRACSDSWGRSLQNSVVQISDVDLRKDWHMALKEVELPSRLLHMKDLSVASKCDPDSRVSALWLPRPQHRRDIKAVLHNSCDVFDSRSPGFGFTTTLPDVTSRI